MLIDTRKLDFYAANNLNVLFEGDRGVGKTSLIYNTFNKANMKIKYFSAPTMDPWTDLIGIPKNVLRPDGIEVLKYILPEDLVDNQYDAIFIDELNRAPPKVMNALMELIQFKTINGKPYNIKMIWAAINPFTDDNTYDVERLDPAIEDRFQIKIKVPYKVDIDLFKENFQDTGVIFCNWWNEQPMDVRKQISPRRLFESVKFFNIGGDISDILYHGNIDKLKQDLKDIQLLKILDIDMANNSISEQSINLLSKPYNKLTTNFLSIKKNLMFFIEHVDKDWLSKQLVSNNKFFQLLKDDLNHPVISPIIQSIVDSNLKSIFVVSNQNVLSDFLTSDNLEAINNINLNVSLIPSSNDEFKFNSQFNNFSNVIINKKLFTSSDWQSHSKSYVANILTNASKLIKTNKLTEDFVTDQFAYRLAYLSVYNDKYFSEVLKKPIPKSSLNVINVLESDNFGIKLPPNSDSVFSSLVSISHNKFKTAYEDLSAKFVNSSIDDLSANYKSITSKPRVRKSKTI